MTPSPSSSPATESAVALLGQFVRLGVRDLVLSPGSRSQALALAAAEFERAGLLRLRVRIDERVAGFLALGLAVETGLPTLLVTTSGTAVANLHPAVLEAHHSGVPLIVVSADRPAALRGIGSNQTTVQHDIFGTAARTIEADAPAGAAGETDAARRLAATAFEAATAAPGPVHLNLAYSEPLSSALPAPLDPADFARETPPRPAAAAPLVLEPRPATVVVAGTGAGPDAERIARELGAPLLAEVTSGAHFGPNLVVAYRELLGTAGFGDRVERVVILGHPTLSREVPALVQRDRVTTIVVRTPGADDYNPGHRVDTFADAVRVDSAAAAAVDSAARAWVGRWVSASRSLLETDPGTPASELSQAEFARRELAAVREPVDRRMLVEAVWRATWPHDRLVLGASRLIRVADAAVPGKRIRVHANRGLAGIDGTIATATGIALASQALDPEQPNRRDPAGVTRVLLGDLAALHDAGALAFGVGEERPRLQVIVGNDGGGTIFDGLEVAATADSASLDRVLLTPQQVDFASLAAAFGWQYVRATTRGELDQALTASAQQVLIEVPLPR